MYLIRKKENNQYLKIRPGKNDCIELEIDEDNPVYFVTENHSLAEKICDRSSHFHNIEDLAGYNIIPPLDRKWQNENGEIKIIRNIFEIVEIVITMD